jgi:hypothetical protein
MLASRTFFGFASADFSGSSATAIVVAAKKPLNTVTTAIIRAGDMGFALSEFEVKRNWKTTNYGSISGRARHCRPLSSRTSRHAVTSGLLPTASSLPHKCS